MYFLTGFNFLECLTRASQAIQFSVVWCKTSFTFLCSKDFLIITNGIATIFGLYCGNKTGENLLVTGDQVKILFKSNDKVEQRGYRLVFTLISPALVSTASVAHGK